MLILKNYSDGLQHNFGRRNSEQNSKIILSYCLLLQVLLEFAKFLPVGHNRQKIESLSVFNIVESQTYLNFTKWVPIKESLKTFATLLRRISKHLLSRTTISKLFKRHTRPRAHVKIVKRLVQLCHLVTE